MRKVADENWEREEASVPRVRTRMQVKIGSTVRCEGRQERIAIVRLSTAVLEEGTMKASLGEGSEGAIVDIERCLKSYVDV